MSDAQPSSPAVAAPPRGALTASGTHDDALRGTAADLRAATENLLRLRAMGIPLHTAGSAPITDASAAAFGEAADEVCGLPVALPSWELASAQDATAGKGAAPGAPATAGATCAGDAPAAAAPARRHNFYQMVGRVFLSPSGGTLADTLTSVPLPHNNVGVAVMREPFLFCPPPPPPDLPPGTTSTRPPRFAFTPVNSTVKAASRSPSASSTRPSALRSPTRSVCCRTPA